MNNVRALSPNFLIVDRITADGKVINTKRSDKLFVDIYVNDNRKSMNLKAAFKME